MLCILMPRIALEVKTVVLVCELNFEFEGRTAYSKHLVSALSSVLV